jgi:ribosomal protein S18 acetylase RimI-like enzyme
VRSATVAQIQALEAVSANGWAAPHTAVLDGWVLRAAGGYTRRANSVLPLYDGALPLEEKIEASEQFYQRYRLPTHFKLTEAAQPAELDVVLEGRGYTEAGRTSVQVRDLHQELPDEGLSENELDIRNYPSTIWLDSFFRMNHIDAAHYGMVRLMLEEHLLFPARFVIVWEGVRPVAVALLVLERGYAGIFDVVVQADSRGQGIGARLMSLLLWQARFEGAHTAYLQVTHANRVAWRLYGRLGFSPLYDYWYRRQPSVG